MTTATTIEYPGGVTVHVDTPNGHVVSYPADMDASDVEASIGPAWSVDWETAAVRSSCFTYWRAPVGLAPGARLVWRCSVCGSGIAYDAPGCAEHPGEHLEIEAMPPVPGRARLTERKRERSRCCDVAGAVDLELELHAAGLVGEVDLGAVGVRGTVRITLVPDPCNSGSYRPYGDTLDVWMSDDGVMARLPEVVRAYLISELASWLGDSITVIKTREIEYDLSEVAS